MCGTDSKIRLDHKNIVITGANKGIGRAILESCASGHANVWACMRTIDDSVKKRIEELEKKYETSIKIVEMDLRNQDSVKRAAKEILADKVPITGLVNNAGTIGADKAFLFNSMDNIRDTFEVNVFGPMYFTQLLLKRMMRSKGASIVNISSVSAFDGEPGRIDYIATKAAINGITKKLANVYGEFGIRVNSVAPGIIDTDSIENISDELKSKIFNDSALKRIGESKEIAEMVSFLLSDHSSYVTGQIIRVDGGRI